jgi:tetratricopeptide (TPR) repeat protein
VKAGWRSILSGLGVLAGFVLVTWALSNGQLSLGRAGGELFWFLVVFLIVIPIHELGHALAGFLVGHRIRSVVVGVGRPLLAFDLGGVAIRINLLPFGGLTMGTPRAGGWLRLRIWIFAAGGPAANVALCYVLHRLYGHAGPPMAEQHRLASVAASASWTILLLNLIPFKTAEGGNSDGYALLTVPFWKGPELEEARLVVEALPLIEALGRDDIDTAAPLAEALLARFPGHRMIASLLGSVRHRQGRQQEAIAWWHQALAKCVHPRQIAFLKNNIAFAEVVVGDPASLVEADAFSAAAFAAHPELTPFVGTRGAVLVRLGRAAEGLPLLERAAAAPTPNRSQAYNRASLASALAMLGRTAEARRELDDARRMNPACELLDAAEADLRAAPAVPVALPAATGILPAVVWERWGGLARWRQVARGLAFVYTLAPLHGGSIGIATMTIAIVIMLNPESTGLLAFAACNLWIAAVDRSDVTVTLLTSLAGLLAIALAAVRPRLGPSAPSQVPLVLAWILGALATLLTAAVPLGLAIRHHRHALPSALKLGLHSFRPSPSDAVLFVGWATVLLLGRRRWTRLFAIVPLGIALVSLSGHRAGPLREAHFDNIPVDGAPVVWGVPRPATALRSARFPATKIMSDLVLSPGGGAFFTRFFEEGQTEKRRHGIRVRDFEGHVVELDGFAATFVDDQRMLLVRPAPAPEPGIELSEVRPFASPAPLWSRRIGELAHASVEVEPDGATIALTGSSPKELRTVVVRTGFGRDAPLRVVAIPSLHQDADGGIGFFFTPDGEPGSVVLRERAARGGGSPFVPTDQRDWESNDLELWALRPAGETLLAAHLPDPNCHGSTVGRPLLWCTVGWGENRALLKIDAAAGRVSRIADALPKWGTAELIAPQRLAVVSYGQRGLADRLGVVDLETRRGTWLELPTAGSATVEASNEGARSGRVELVRDGLATFVDAGEGQDATLTVYATP